MDALPRPVDVAVRECDGVERAPIRQLATFMGAVGVPAVILLVRERPGARERKQQPLTVRRYLDQRATLPARGRGPRVLQPCATEIVRRSGGDLAAPVGEEAHLRAGDWSGPAQPGDPYVESSRTGQHVRGEVGALDHGVG